MHSLKKIFTFLNISELSQSQLKDFLPLLKLKLDDYWTISSISGDNNIFIVSNAQLHRILTRDYKNEKVMLLKELSSWYSGFTGSLNDMTPSPQGLKKIVSCLTSGGEQENNEFDRSTDAIADIISFNHLKYPKVHSIF